MAQSKTQATVETRPNNPRADVLPENAVVEQTPSGGLVYEVETEYSTVLGRTMETGRTLVGFVDVTDWQGVRDELRKRGKGTGATRHLPEYRRD